ncbi:PQQ-dependent sugar dehydrogenase [Haloferula sargassicola]|uniref:Aldose sugar dehydrogenase YliI n=1 Tax=Haloferula sargassicola TaxID=490096 RepID=A0ABP9UML3_9BACT
MRCLVPALLLAAPLFAEPTTVTFASGFDRPVWVGAPPQDREHLWVVEQAGKIWKLDAKTGKRADEPFLDIVSRVSRAGNEEGLLGLAFPPDFAESGRFYINYTNKDHVSHIERGFAVGPDFEKADDSKAEKLFEYKQPWQNHNGGWLAFGPDGYLYVGTGDGGAGNDPHGNGQKLDTLLGKLLRADVSPDHGIEIPDDNPFVGQEGAQELIWAYGLRNPWRCSFDRKTGDLWIGDVGQNKWEEIDFVPKGEGAGANFGWRLREGTHRTPDVGGNKPKEHYIEPVYDYDHGSGPKDGLSVTGGYVYRGKIKGIQGRYIFADYQNRRLWSFVLKGGKVTDFQDHTDSWKPEGGQIGLVSSFGEDPDGELYLTCLEGTVLKVVDQ